MSVFTTVSFEQLKHWLNAYPLGDLLDLKGIAAGITNTNYFVTTSSGRYVLTLFEEHSAQELPYYLNLMAHLSGHGVPCPHPVAKLDGENLGELNGKPAALVTCLTGRDLEMPTALHCAEIGRVLAQMHLAGQSFNERGNNTRDEQWRVMTAKKVLPLLSAEEAAMLKDMLVFQAGFTTAHLPHGLIHADLFRDNVLFDGDEVGGLIDFYYACHDVLLYDVAIAVNDWCTLIHDDEASNEEDREDAQGALDIERAQTFLQAYHQVRPLSAAEHQAWPSLLRIAALRFWLSRLHDCHFPQAGELTHAKDPAYFQRILKNRSDHPVALAELLAAKRLSTEL